MRGENCRVKFMHFVTQCPAGINGRIITLPFVDVGLYSLK